MSENSGRPTITSSLAYKDPMAALKWLEGAFGFEISMVITNAEGALEHSEMTVGDGYIMIGAEWCDWVKAPPTVNGANTQYVHVHLTDGIDEHYERARASGATIVRELQDQFYGDRTYIAADPEGHHWSFGQTVRKVTREEAAAVSGLNIEGWV